MTTQYDDFIHFEYWMVTRYSDEAGEVSEIITMPEASAPKTRHSDDYDSEMS